jgi:drug/metabolite transporter (DMT)-like permease
MRGIVFALTSAVGFGALPFFTKTLYAAGIDVPTVLALRFTLAATILVAVLATMRPDVLELPARSARNAFLMGLVGYTGQASLFFLAISELKSGLASVLLYLNPIFVTLLAALLRRRRPRAIELTAVLAVVVGCVLIADVTAAAISVLGIASGIGAALWYAAYILVGEHVLKNDDQSPLGISAYVFVGSTVGFLGYAAFRAVALGDRMTLPQDVAGWGATVGLAVVSTVIPCLAFFAAIKAIGAARATIVSTFEPVVTLFLGLWLLDEQLGLGQWIGVASVLGTIVMLQIPRSTPPRARVATTRELAA